MRREFGSPFLGGVFLGGVFGFGPFSQPDGGGDVFGPNLVINGDISDGTTAWTPLSGAVLTANNNRLQVTKLAGDNLAYANQGISTDFGALYFVEMTRTAMDNTNSFWGISSTPTGTLDLLELDSAIIGSAAGYFTGTGSTVYIRLGVDGTTEAPKTTEYDNISVREVLSGGESWILTDGTWNDVQPWSDTDLWNDGV